MSLAQDFDEELTSLVGKRNDVISERYPLNYENGQYSFLRIASAYIDPADKVVCIAAGIHGDEISGPMTILRHFDEIVNHAHTMGVKLIVYPLRNPSGFNNTRYNIDNDNGVSGNNDFLRYRLKTGEIVDDLKSSNDFAEWYWSSDPKLTISLPLETCCMIDLLKKDPLTQIVAAIDIHQDYLTPHLPPCAYHYAFGDLKAYQKIVQDIEALLPVLKNVNISAGYGVQIDAAGKAIILTRQDDNTMLTDASGFIVRHDGTLVDLFDRIGVKYCVNPETSGATPIDLACKVNLLWIKGLINLASKS